MKTGALRSALGSQGFRLLLGTAVSVLCLYLAARTVEWAGVFAAIKDGEPRWLLAGVALGIGTFVVFAARWSGLLAAAGRIGVGRAFSTIMIGYLAGTFLPFRAGDMTRAVLLGRHHRVGVSLVLGSIVLERLLDVLTILLMALGLSFLMDIPPAVRTGMLLFTCAALSALAVLCVLAYGQARASRPTEQVKSRLPRALADGLAGIVSRFAEGLKALRDIRQFGTAVFLSLVAWVLAGMGTLCYIAAFNLDVPWYAGFFLLVVLNLGAAIPSSPGYVGVYHYLAVLALSVWLDDRNAAMGYAIATHGLNMAVNVALGSACLWREGIGLTALSRMRRPQGECPACRPAPGAP